MRVASRPAAEAFPYPPSMPLTASDGEEPAGHWGEDFVAHIEAPGLDLNHLTSGDQVLRDGDILGLLPGPKWGHWLLLSPATLVGSADPSPGSSVVQEPAGDAPAAPHLNPTPNSLGLGPAFPTVPRVGEPYRKETWLEGAGKTFTVSIPQQLRPCPKVTRI